MNTRALSSLRYCLRDPIPEIEQAATLLQSVVVAHLAGRKAEARELLADANIPAVRDWTESLWGKDSRFAPTGPYWSTLPPSTTVPKRMPGVSTQRELHARDGYYCRFCGIPVVRKQVRQRLRLCYPEVWGRKNVEQHAALQCMWVQYDHLIPHSRGGSNDLSNLVITCAPCNYGRMQYTLEEAGLQDPFLREPRKGGWRGLEEFLSHQPSSE
jgi:5-methylcytosine-specific restriction endonuclease McrA